MDWMGVFVEVPNKLTSGEKVLQVADLVLPLQTLQGWDISRLVPGSWDTLARLGSHRMGQA